MNDQAAPAAPQPSVVRSRVSPAKLIKWSIAAIVLLAAIFIGIHYWRLSQRFVTTDNAAQVKQFAAAGTR